MRIENYIQPEQSEHKLIETVKRLNKSGFKDSLDFPSNNEQPKFYSFNEEKQKEQQSHDTNI